jgi:PAS domain S-box-containing protein
MSAALIYGLVLVLTAAMWLARRLLGLNAGEPLLEIFLAPILVAAYLGGLWPGLFATLLAAAVSLYVLFPVPPYLSSMVAWLSLLLEGVLVSVLSQGLHRARQQALDTQQLQASTLVSIGDAVIVVNAQNQVTFLNAEASRLTKWQPSAALGQPLERIYPILGDISREPAEPLQGARLEQSLSLHRAHPIVLRDRDGGETPITETVTLIRSPRGALLGAAFVFRDIAHHLRAARERQENEEHFRLLLAGAKEYALFMLTPEGLIATWNSGAERIKGYSADEIIGQRFEIFYRPADVARGVPAQMLAAAQAHGIAENEGWRVRADGSEFWASVLITALYDEHGQLRGFSKLTRDITERRAAEFALQESEARLKNLLENLPECVIYQLEDMPGQSSRFTYISENIAQLCGVAASDVMDDPGVMYRLLDPEWCERVKVAEHIAFQHMAPFHAEVPLRHTDGPLRWLRLSSVPHRAASGTVVWDGVMIDITERVQVEAALREERDRFITLVETVPGVVHSFQIQPNGSSRFPYMSARIRDLFPLTPEQLALDASMFSTFWHPEDYDRVMASLKLSHQQLTPWNSEFRILNSERGELWLETHAIPRRQPDNSVIWYGVLQDITDRKQAEAELRTREEQLNLAYDAGNMGTWRLDPANLMVSFDLLAKQHFGVASAVMSVEDVLTRIHADDLDAVRVHLEKVLDPATGGRYSAEFRIIHPDGSTHWLVAHVRMYFRHQEGVQIPVLGVGTIQDATLIRQGEEQIRQQAARLQVLSDASRAFTAVGPDFQTVLHEITTTISRTLGDVCTLRLIDPETNRFGVAAIYDDTPEQYAIMREIMSHIPVDAAILQTSQRVMASAQPLLLAPFDNKRLRDLIPRRYHMLVDKLHIHSAIIAPLRTQGVSFGVLYVSRHRPERPLFDSNDLSLVQDLADRAALAISNAQLYGAIQQSHAALEARVTERTAELRAALERVRTLYAITNDAIGSDDLDDALQRTIERVAATLSADRIVMVTFDLAEHRIERHIAGGPNRNAIQQLATADDYFSGLAGWAMRELRPAISAKGRPDQRESVEIQQRRKHTQTGSMIVAPLVSGDEAFGVLMALNTLDDPDFTVEDVDLMIAVSSQVSVVYARNRLTARLQHTNAALANEIAERTELARWQQQQTEQAIALATLSQAMAEIRHDLQALFNTITQRIACLMDDVCVLSLLSEDRLWMQPVALAGPLSDEIEMLKHVVDASPDRADTGWSAAIAISGQALLLSNIPVAYARSQIDARYSEFLEGLSEIYLLIVPLRARGRVLGSISLTRIASSPPYSLADKRFLQDLADRAGLAIENARLFAEAEQARAEAERANRAKSAFLASISHELRTPLNAIVGFTGTLLMRLPGPLTLDQERQLTTIQRSSRHLLALINDLLDLARIESGRAEIRLAPVPCQELLAEVVASLRPLADGKQIGLHLRMPEDHVRIQSDGRALRQILINLVNNAVKFTDSGEVWVGLEQRDQQILISVADTGIGIRPEDQARLFQEFGRADTVEVRAREGTGLGLRISRKLAELLGGTIELSSVFGKGSTFTLILPVEYTAIDDHTSSV